MANHNLLQQLYKRLSAVGFTRPYLRNYVLPESWRDEMASDPKAYSRLLVFLSRHLRIQQASIKDNSQPLVFEPSLTRFFKGTDFEKETDAGLRIAEGVAAVALSGTKLPITTIPSAATIRQSILKQQPWVSFPSLVAYCWQIGVPVLHVQNLPTGTNKLRGVAVEIDGRAAIVLCQRFKQPARQLSPLAHELGHLAADHLGYANMMAKASIEEEVKFNDRTEMEAHRYTRELITGGQIIPPDYRQYRSISSLVRAMTERGEQMKIDPGYLIVHRATSTHNWREANAALAEIDGSVDALDLINSQAVVQIKWEDVSLPSRSFFWRTTGAPEPVVPLPSYRSTQRQVLASQQPLSPTVTLFRRWATEDATEDPNVLALREQEIENLLRRLDRSRFNLAGRTVLSESDDDGEAAA